MYKKILFLFLLILLFIPIYPVKSIDQERVFSYNICSFEFEVYSYPQVRVNEEFNILFVIEPWSTINVETVELEIYGNLGNNGEWLDPAWDHSRTALVYAATRHASQVQAISPLTSRGPHPNRQQPHLP